MKLVRFAILSFNPSPQEQWKRIGIENSRINLKTFPITIDKKPNQDWVMCQAELTLQTLPILTQNNTIQIPEEPRKELERSINDISNIIAVAEMSQRTISSPHPCVGFRPENKDELSWLNKTNGIEYNLKMIPSFRFTLENEIKNANLLQDRLEGVALMAEALANLHPSGKLHELMRVFENAFATNSTSLVILLSQFLDNSPFKFNKKDIKFMIKKLRDRFTHADMDTSIMIESDIRPYIYKIEEVAYDVLFNKDEWHNSSIKRRDILKPKAGVRGDGTAFTYQHNKEFTHIGQLLDPFGSYPFNLSGSFTNNVAGIWFKKIGEHNSIVTEEYPFHVEPDNPKSKSE